MSGFFFCGMIDDPVAQASSSRAQPNSVDVQSTTSSPSRERCTPSSAAAKQNSAAKSRSLTASMRVVRRAVEAELGGDRVGVQAERGAGQRAGAERADRRPLVPVLQPVDVAGDRVGVRQQLVGDEHRLRVLQVRHARGGDVLVPLGQAEQRVLQATTAPTPAPGRCAAGTAAGRWPPGRCGCARRAACRRAAPSFSSRPRSSASCTSSSASIGANVPATTSADSSVERADHLLELVVGEQPGPVQHPGVRPGRRQVVGRQPPVDVGGLGQRGHRRRGPPPKRPPQSRVCAGCRSVTSPAAARGRRPASTACPTAGRSPWPGPGRRCRRCRRWRG